LYCSYSLSLDEEEKEGYDTMKCFYHAQDDAVAQCAHCQKGLCPDCSFDFGTDGIYCYRCLRDDTNADYARAQRRIVGLWIFTGVSTVIGAIAAISSDGAVGILLAPVIFAAAWCFYWGWLSVWGWVRGRGFSFVSVSSSDGDPVGTIVRLMVIALLIEVVIFVVMVIGLFTGIQKYRKNKRLIALVKRGWLNEFPGKYVPELGYVPAAQGEVGAK